MSQLLRGGPKFFEDRLMLLGRNVSVGLRCPDPLHFQNLSVDMRCQYCINENRQTHILYCRVRTRGEGEDDDAITFLSCELFVRLI